jgi:hypothetical protein
MERASSKFGSLHLACVETRNSYEDPVAAFKSTTSGLSHFLVDSLRRIS